MGQLYLAYVNRQLPRLERGCTSKAAFGTRREAKAYARQGRLQDGSLSPYHCGYCDLWHLAHRRGKARRRRERSLAARAA